MAPGAAGRASRVNGQPVGLVRGVLAERVVISAPLDPYLTLTGAADYTRLSVKTLRRAVNDHPARALPAYRVGAVILLRRSDVDRWLAERRTVGRPSLVAALRALGLRPGA
jgi:excisionase family DNA binding protein